MEHKKEILFSEEDIKNKIGDLAKEIQRDYDGKSPVFLGILKGSFIFLADLVRAVNIDCEIDFIGASSYGKSDTSSGVIKITKDLSFNIENRDIIIVEDIVDTGKTINKLMVYLQSFKPKSIKICTLIDKKERREKVVTVDYSCFKVDEGFLIGYGLDYAHKYRNLPDICVCKF